MQEKCENYWYNFALFFIRNLFPHSHHLPHCGGGIFLDTSYNSLSLGAEPGKKKIDGWNFHLIPTAFSEPSNDANIDISRKEREEDGVRGFGNRLLADAATEDPERPIERRSDVFLHFSLPFTHNSSVSSAPSEEYIDLLAIYFLS